MVYHGKVKNGVIVLDPPIDLPDGTEVIVETAPNGRWDKCVGTISEAEARGMLSAIEETCERIDGDREH